jgi:hypothetical protein
MACGDQLGGHWLTLFAVSPWSHEHAGNPIRKDVGMTDPRASAEYRIPATQLREGDLVNTSPGEDDWQRVLGVYTKVGQAKSDEVRTLVESLGGRYVVVQLTDIAPVDSGVYFADGLAMMYAVDDGADQDVTDVISSEDGVRTYLYTKFELVTVRVQPS